MLKFAKPVSCLLLAMFLFLQVQATATEKSVDEERLADLSTMMEQAVARFETQQYIEAKAILDQILAKEPTNEEAWRLRSLFGIKILSDMASYIRPGVALDSDLATLGTAPVELLKRAMRAEQDDLLDPVRMADIINTALSQVEGRNQALRQVAIMGQYAVPELIKHVISTNQYKRANASFILINLGQQVVLPLCAALDHKDDATARAICQVLMDIRPVDTRALPYLKAIQEDSTRLESVRIHAQKAIEAISGKEVDKVFSAAELFYNEAQRYYIGGREIEEECATLRGEIWGWDAQDDTLKHKPIPEFLMPDQLAQELAFRGLKAQRNSTDLDRLAALVVSSYFQQKRQFDSMEAVLQLKSLTRPDLEKERGNLDEWSSRLFKNERLALTAGTNIITSALNKALLDGKKQVIIAACEALAAIHEGKGLESLLANDNRFTIVEDHPLFLTLVTPDPTQRAAAANALTKITFDSNLQADLRDNIATVLAENAAERQAMVTLVVSHDLNIRTRIARELTDKKFMPLTASDGREGIDIARRFPFPDVILLDSEVHEFRYLADRLAMQKLAAGSVLPITIIASKARIPYIATALSDRGYRVEVPPDKVDPNANEPLAALADVDAQSIYDASADDKRSLLSILTQSQQRNIRSGEKPLVVILTAERAEERRAIKQALLSKVESVNNVQSQFMRLFQQQNELPSNFALSSSMANVFLDDELSGYNARKTLLELRADPRSWHIPVILLCKSGMVNQTSAEYREFITRGGVSVMTIPDDIASYEYLVEQILEQGYANPVAKADHVRNMIEEYALKSALSLRNIPVTDSTVLSETAVNCLIDVVTDETRRVGLRAACARAIGHYKVQSCAEKLTSTMHRVKDNLQQRELLVACLEALGQVDIDKNYVEDKIQMLTSTDKNVQAAAALGLAWTDNPPGGNLFFMDMLERTRFNSSRSLADNMVVKTMRIDFKELENASEQEKNQVLPLLQLALKTQDIDLDELIRALQAPKSNIDDLEEGSKERQYSELRTRLESLLKDDVLTIYYPIDATQTSATIASIVSDGYAVPELDEDEISQRQTVETRSTDSTSSAPSSLDDLW